MRGVLQDYAEHRFANDKPKQAALTSTSLLRIESQLIAEAITHWVISTGATMSTPYLGEKLTLLRKYFYNMGRMFAQVGPEIVLGDIACSYKPDSPIPLSLYNTLKAQVALQRAVQGVKAVPGSERGNSKVPSAALLATEMAHLLAKEARELKEALLHGTRAAALSNVARLRAVLAASTLFGGRTSDTLFFTFSSVWVNMMRAVVPAAGGQPRLVPVRMPVAALTLAGADVLHAFISQPGLVLTTQVRQSPMHLWVLHEGPACPRQCHLTILMPPTAWCAGAPI
jgi:hypothetical protein